MTHSNAMTAQALLIDELHRVVLEHAEAIGVMDDLIRHTANPAMPPHKTTCERCTRLALKLQSHQNRIRKFQIALTKAVGVHYPPATILDRPR